jgi:hypothetical protein
MRKFAGAGNKVIFVNSISMGLPSLGHKDLLPRIKRKLGSYSKRMCPITKITPRSRRLRRDDENVGGIDAPYDPYP